jgi:hypothetical protein
MAFSIGGSSEGSGLPSRINSAERRLARPAHTVEESF